MKLPESFLENLKQSSDIVSVMSVYVTPKRSGRDYVCVCPFHADKNPSCHIYPDTQSFFCFGCGTGGDVITFIRLIEHLEYMDSVRFLADRAGLTVPAGNETDATSKKRVRMLTMNKDAARFFRDVLLSDAGKPGLDYLAGRGLTPGTIKKYGLGFAPDSWHALQEHLRGKGYTDQEMIEAALLVKKENSRYDKFRNRVMFPIIDKRGNIIAFGGRTLEPTAPAKYLNSDETMVFRKRENIFSINFAKNTKENFLILCEGYMDVITLNQAGFDNAVATLGTAITSQQASLMRGIAEEAVISYDADEAGQKAALRAINLLTEAGITARVLKIPDAKDPDEYIKRFGAENFRQILSGSVTALDHEFNRLTAGINTELPEGKTKFLKKAVPFLAGIRSHTEREVYISEAAKLTGQQPDMVRSLVNDQMKYNSRNARRDEERRLIAGTTVRDSINPSAVDYPVEERAERGVIAYLFHSPDRLPYIEKKISESDFPTEFNRKLFGFVAERIRNGESIDLSSIGGEFTTEEVGRITGICRQADALPYSLPRLDEYMNRLIKHRETANEKPVTELTREEMLQRVEEIRERKKKRQ